MNENSVQAMTALL